MQNLIMLFYSFIKIGFISLGGGNSMLKLLEYEAVNYRHWLNAEEFVAMIGTSFIFPGLTAVKLSALIGYKTAGIAGLLVAVLALNLPGLVLCILGYRWLVSNDSPFTRKIVQVVQYGALALLAAATFSLGQNIIQVNFSKPLLFTSFIFFLALAFGNLSPFYGFLGFIIISYYLI